MSERHRIALLTALIRAQQPKLDGDVAVLQAIALDRGGCGDREIAELIEAALAGWRQPGPGWLRPPADEILNEVDFALAVRGYLGRPRPGLDWWCWLLHGRYHRDLRGQMGSSLGGAWIGMECLKCGRRFDPSKFSAKPRK